MYVWFLSEHALDAITNGNMYGPGKDGGGRTMSGGGFEGDRSRQYEFPIRL
jgi:hypothetical protein